MKNYVAKRLIIKGKESSESMVCMSFSFLLAELASLDSLFVNMIMGQLYKQCPLIRLETSQLDSLSAEEFESIVMKDSMMIRLFAGLFLFNPRLFPIEFAWKWINLVVQLADCTHFLEASHSLEAFLETCGFVLQKEKPRFSNLLKHINEITIPNLSDLPSFTSGSIARLKILVITGVLGATVTAFCGPVAFIGLAVPHVARFLSGTVNHKVIMPLAMVCGAAVALACNFVCNLPAGNGIFIPLNAVMSLWGVPVILYVLFVGYRQKTLN